MVGNSFKLGRIAGIAIGVHWSWFFIFFLLSWSLATAIFDDAGLSESQAWIAGVVTSMIFFGSVLLHELSHSLVAKRYGLGVRDITLFVFGGVSNLEKEAETAKQEFWVAIAGPIVSLVLALLFLLAWATVGQLTKVIGEPTAWLALINGSLFVFNMLPGFPLDGGRVFRAILWGRNRNHLRATALASRSGVWLAWIMIGGGVVLIFAGGFVTGLWMMMIGWFLRNASESSYTQTLMDEVLGGLTVRDVATTEYDIIPPDIDLATLVQDYVFKRHHRCFPVVVADHLQGLITLTDIKAVPQNEWPTTSAYRAMKSRDALHIVSPETPIVESLRMMAEHDVNQLPVLDRFGALLGLVTRADILRLIQVRSEMTAQRGPLPRRDS